MRITNYRRSKTVCRARPTRQASPANWEAKRSSGPRKGRNRVRRHTVGSCARFILAHGG